MQKTFRMLDCFAQKRSAHGREATWHQDQTAGCTVTEGGGEVSGAAETKLCWLVSDTAACRQGILLPM